MKIVTLKIDEGVDEQFSLFLAHFSSSEIQILEQSEYMIDDEYLRSINGMVQTPKKKQEPATAQTPLIWLVVVISGLYRCLL